MKHCLIAWALMLLSCLVSCAGSGEVKTGDKVPDFVLVSDVYGELSDEDLEGKVTYLCFFATWCPPCQKELAAVQNRMFAEFGDNEDFLVIAVGREHTDAELAEYNSVRKFTFPLYPDPDRKVYSLFAAEYIPRAYLIGRDGVVADASSGYDESHFDETMETIRRLLKEE